MPRSRSGVPFSPWWVVILALPAPALAPSARAAAPLLDGNIQGLAAAGDRVVALRDGEVWLLLADGTVIGKAAIEKIDRGSGESASKLFSLSSRALRLRAIPNCRA